MTEKTTDQSEQAKTKRRQIPKRVNLADVSKAFKQALGISSESTAVSMSDIVQNDTLIKEALKNIVPERNLEEIDGIKR